MQMKKPDVQDVVFMYTEHHWTMDEIGRFYGITRQAIYRYLKKAGVKSEQGEHVNVVCIVCDKEFTVTRKRYHKTKRYHCSKECYTITRINPDFVSWRQGSRIARLIVSQYFPLEDEHIVHHKDSNQRNFKIDNLMVFANQSDHLKYHHGNSKVIPLWDGIKI